jgi:hypothetical protein
MGFIVSVEKASSPSPELPAGAGTVVDARSAASAKDRTSFVPSQPAVGLGERV